MSIKSWIESIDKVTEAFQTEFGSLDHARLNYKPDQHTWSVAQNIEHIIAVNLTYFDIPDAVRKGSYKLPWTGRIGFMVRFFGNFILKSVLPDRKRKIRTFPIWEPSQSEVPQDIMRRFVQHQDALKKLIHSSRDLLNKNVVISSPANRNIVYTLEKAFEIIVAHEWRHLEQCRALRRD